MICKEYEELSIIEKTQLIGRAIHLIQNQSEAFLATLSMIRQAENNGLFDNVIIIPDNFNQENNTEI